ncbi:MAG: sugar phosphate isomerase/epimerase [Verrucomicrobia bacterium]|nr:sugar phosphate isomerase/epimerase [Verrucomicrobiota bacterium]
MKFGASTFIWVSPFSNATLDLADKVSRMGFDILEICIEDPKTIDPESIRKSLEKTGLQARVCGAFGSDRDASSDDPAVRGQAVDYIKKCIDFARELKSPIVAGPMYSAVGKTRLLSKDEKQQQWQLAVESLRKAGDYAGEHGVKLAIEPLNRFETDFINTVEQGLELLDRIAIPNVGFLLDTFHMNIEEKDIAAAIRRAGSKIFHFHTCENDRGTPGTGHVDWISVRDALRDAGYQGPVVIEAFNSEITEIARAVALWRPLASSPDALAAGGLDFLKRLFNGDQVTDPHP